MSDEEFLKEQEEKLNKAFLKLKETIRESNDLSHEGVFGIAVGSAEDRVLKLMEDEESD